MSEPIKDTVYYSRPPIEVTGQRLKHHNFECLIAEITNVEMTESKENSSGTQDLHYSADTGSDGWGLLFTWLYLLYGVVSLVSHVVGLFRTKETTYYTLTVHGPFGLHNVMRNSDRRRINAVAAAILDAMRESQGKAHRDRKGRIARQSKRRMRWVKLKSGA
jgi:hypothetical protein